MYDRDQARRERIRRAEALAAGRGRQLETAVRLLGILAQLAAAGTGLEVHEMIRYAELVDEVEQRWREETGAALELLGETAS